MSNPASKISHKLSQPGVLFPLLAFAIPLVVRLIPEVLMGSNIVGFDTMGYYVPGTIGLLHNGIVPWVFISDSPFIYLFTIPVTAAGGSIVLLIKILAPVLLGVLGLMVFFYARNALGWSPKKSLLVTLFATLYFVALRISWDMLRNEFGIIFLFISLIYLQKKSPTIKDSVFLAIALTLTVFSHQLVAVLMFAILLATLIRSAIDKNPREIKRVILCAIPAVILFAFIILINYSVYSLSPTGFSTRYFSGFPIENAAYPEFVADTLGFLIFCYLPLLPFLAFSRKMKSNIQLKVWIVWLLIPVALAIFSPVPFFVGGVLPYRWILLLVYPLSFYAAHGFASIKWRWYKVAAGALLVVLSFCLLALPYNFALRYYNYYPSYVPNSMLQNTVPISECQNAFSALTWAGSNLPQNATLITHQAFYGYAALTVEFRKLYLYGYDDPLSVAQNLTAPNSEIYTVWWVNGSGWYGQPGLADAFHVVHQDGGIAIYHYIP